MARPVGRPNLPYDVRHVTLNIRVEYYVKMKRAGTNMSKIVNDFLHAEHNYTICPVCYNEDIDVQRCAKCGGRALWCHTLGCQALGVAQKRECMNQMEPCSEREFKGEA